jgi:hypothetical protein
MTDYVQFKFKFRFGPSLAKFGRMNSNFVSGADFKRLFPATEILVNLAVISNFCVFLQRGSLILSASEVRTFVGQTIKDIIIMSSIQVLASSNVFKLYIDSSHQTAILGLNQLRLISLRLTLPLSFILV